MKYLYKQTGVVVESSVALDSTIFTPVTTEKNSVPDHSLNELASSEKVSSENKSEVTEKPVKKTTRKTTTSRTAKK